MRRRQRWMVVLLATAAAGAELRPATVTWGGVSNQQQLAGADGQWEFVARHMDAFFMHGAYWLFQRQPADLAARRALGAVLARHGKPAHLETGFGEGATYDPTKPERRGPHRRAVEDIAKLREFRDAYGIRVTKVRVDWFPMPAMAAYARYWKTTDMRALLAMVTGAEDTFGPVPAGFDLRLGHWREYVTLLEQALPGIELAFDQAPCNHRPLHDPAVRALVPWPAFGYGYTRTPDFGDGRPVLLDGQPIQVKFDFADQLMGALIASRQARVNFIGFEGDTPYNYLTDGPADFPRDKLMAYLLAIEARLHAQGLRNGRIINDCGPAYGDGDSGWVQVDLGVERSIDRVKLVWGAGWAQAGIVRTSADGRAWDVGAAWREGREGPTELKFRARNARYVKFEGRRRGTPDGYQLAEFEAYGPLAPTANLAAGRTANVSSRRANAQRSGLKVVTDGDQQTLWESHCLPNDAWDLRFHDRTLEYFEVWQAAGGRSDEYIAESWYDGPFTLFPETRRGTFSSLARYLLRRVKGLDDDSARLPLGLRHARGTLTVTNQARDRLPGDARALPLLRAALDPGVKLTCRDGAGRDVTDAVLARGEHDGWFVGGLDAGCDTPLTVEATGAGQARFAVYWNAQDPSRQPRATVVVAAGEARP